MGRCDILACAPAWRQVVSLLCPQRYRCVTIRGPPGIGKTAVAFRACEYMVSSTRISMLHSSSHAGVRKKSSL
jgi:hypothetical protein